MNIIIGSSIEQLILEHLIVYWGYSFVLMVYGGYIFSPPLKAIAVVLFNQCMVGYSMLYALPIIPTITYTGSGFTDLIERALCMMMYYVLHCIWFYCTHRLMHVRFFWRHIHQIHHTYKETLPYAAFYCHPFEHLFVNLMSGFIGPILFSRDVITLKIWFHIGTLNSVNAHYSDIRGDTPGNHDLHHIFYRFNYGTGNVMDRIFGTYMKPAKL